MEKPTDTPARARRSGVQSIEIGGDLLEAMVQLGAPAPLSDIAAAAGLPAAKAHRYLTSLCEIGLTLQHDTGRYGLGPLALRMGLSAIAQHDIIERAYEVLVSLCDELRTSGHLSVWSDVGPVVIRSAHGGPPVISPVAVGTVLPLQRSASGFVYLSFMPEAATADAVRSQGASDQADRAELNALCRKTATVGYALASGQYIPGLCAIALPIFNHDKTLAGAITLVSTDTNAFTDASPATRRAIEAVHDLKREWTHEPDKMGDKRA
ncbi:IclR family transcriptional regulator [Sulfitobacter sp. S190]|uniref:IclR family transcriptional regulator n=1 Tax=Sulfitobacter sp. S190 TaxID=2867022 RepID=UPI0021A5C248|nr:IclR family transcriptional regulator [Sulfitobacter sp. S190]UWR22132.1 IclR family transcriptional regulator [Sulfitobacter sp. S190]